MPNRYANLTPSAKISQEYTKITEGFDKVQMEMDERIQKENDLQQQLNAVVVEATDSDAMSRQAAVGANGHDYKNLKLRLDTEYNEIIARLAQKADVTYVDGKISQIGSATPKGAYATLAELQAAYPTGATGIYVVQADGKWYYWSGTAWTAGGQYQSTGIANNSIQNKHLVNRAVTLEKTDFLEVASNNLFDKDSAVLGYTINPTTGEPAPSANNYLSQFIEIKPNTQYTFDKVSRIGYYTETYTFISTTLYEEPTVTTITTPSNAKYVRLVILSGRENTAQFNEGSTLAAYDEYRVNLKKYSPVIATENIVDEAVTSVKRTKIGNAISIICATGVPNIQNDGTARSITFPVETVFYTGKKVITLSEETTITLPGTYHNYLFINANTGEFKVLTSVYQIAGLSENDVNIGTLTFVGSEIRSIDIPCEYTYNGQPRYALKSDLDNLSPNKSYYKPEVIPEGWYEAPTVEGYEATSHYTDTISFSDVYDVYDTIVADNPEWATKTELGMDASGTYPIYRYEFKPVDVESSLFTKVKPKIILFTNVHGEEKSSTISLRNFMRDVANNWAANPLLEYVRWNVHLVIIPIANPYGFANHHRKNANGVDLNRNSEYRWNTSDSSDPSSTTYKGPAPFSEVETQYIRDTILANLDAVACFDYHMNGTSGSEYGSMFWHYIENFSTASGFTEMNILSKNNISKLTREGHKRYSIPTSSGFIGYISYNSASSTIAAYAYSKGIPAATIECTRKIVGEANVYSAATMKLCTEFIGNAIINTVRAFLDN